MFGSKGEKFFLYFSFPLKLNEPYVLPWKAFEKVIIFLSGPKYFLISFNEASTASVPLLVKNTFDNPE